MKYFFVLGNNPALSAAEILAVLRPESEARLMAGNILALEYPATDTAALIRRLGGTIKIGTLLNSASRHDNAKIKELILGMIDDDLAGRAEKNKYCFGFSHYGQSGLPVFAIGLEIKKILKQRKVSCRLVTSKEKTLSSVVVEQNKLVGSGAEIVLIEEAGTLYLGRTEAVQPFKELSFRDFGRPERDDASGMIPPKLAQIMLNLSGKAPLLSKEGFGGGSGGITFLDPFCGSGTILMEAALLGVNDLIGSDISAKAIADTKKNLAWVGEKNPNLKSQISNLRLFNISADKISANAKPSSIDAIITEPYLGPQRGRFDPLKTKIELEKLYSATLAEFKKIIKLDGRVVMVFPVRAEGERPDLHFLSPSLEGWQVVNPLPENLQDKLHTTRRGTIVYGRPGQKVWREIVILTRKLI